jgi:hypothetical protein
VDVARFLRHWEGDYSLAKDGPGRVLVSFTKAQSFQSCVQTLGGGLRGQFSVQRLQPGQLAQMHAASLGARGGGRGQPNPPPGEHWQQAPARGRGRGSLPAHDSAWADDGDIAAAAAAAALAMARPAGSSGSSSSSWRLAGAVPGPAAAAQPAGPAAVVVEAAAEEKEEAVLEDWEEQSVEDMVQACLGQAEGLQDGGVGESNGREDQEEEEEEEEEEEGGVRREEDASLRGLLPSRPALDLAQANPWQALRGADE